jgi:hypothetical protein
MNLMWFCLIPYTEPLEDFKQKHSSIWFDMHSLLFHPKRAYLMYSHGMNELEYVASSLVRRTTDAMICVM